MIHNVYPVLMTEKLTESHLFYQNYFQFEATFSSEWYISLKHPNGSEIAFIDAQHETIAEQYRGVTQGMIINIEVDNATQLYKEMLEKNPEAIVMPLQDEEYGQRHFMMQDPNAILIDIIEEIPASEAFQDNYKTGEMA